jgi:hypothetical protein
MPAGTPPQRVVITSTIPVGTRLVLDASLSETHRRQGDVTRQPVESGAALTDHFVVAPREVDIVGVVSNAPIVTSGSPVLPATASGNPATRAEDAFRELERVQREGVICSISTTLATYDNMWLTALSVPRDAARGGVAELAMTWTELRFAETQIIAVPAPANRKSKLGKQGSKEGTQKQGDQLRSVLRGFY